MKTLSKLKLNSLKNENVLSQEKMREVRGSGAGLCYFSCPNETYIIPNVTCATVSNPCGNYGFCWCV